MARAFPLLDRIVIFNQLPQIYKRSYQPNKNDQISLVAEFANLTQLYLRHQHIDYVEQFLLATNTHLPRLTHLKINYEHLQIVTENFTRDIMHLNCGKLNHFEFERIIVPCKDFCQYFPCYK
jgi:hypothetical protein